MDLEAPLLVLVVKDAPKVFKPTSSGFDPQLLVPRSTTSAQAVHFQADSKGYEVPVGFHGLVGFGLSEVGDLAKGDKRKTGPTANLEGVVWWNAPVWLETFVKQQQHSLMVIDPVSVGS